MVKRTLFFLLLCALLSCQCSRPSAPAAPAAPTADPVEAPKASHPLDPLTADEIRTTVRVLRAAPAFPADGRFATIALQEPAKNVVLGFTTGSTLARHAMAVVLDRRGGHTFEATVDIVAPHHQHFFNFRLDFDVDGQNNTVVEMNTRAVARSPRNPWLNAMAMESTPLASERKAQRSMDLQAARTWQVTNPSVHNALGHESSYVLVPGLNSVPYAAPTSQVRRRAGFINNHLWVTRFNAAEVYAAGSYPNQSRGGEGLPLWTANDEPLLNQDVVVWYTVGLTHLPRPEEWPVMPAAHIGFKLLPAGFFSRNPALDVPR